MKKGYNPVKLLDFCKINPFTDSLSCDRKANLVTKILAIIVTEKDAEKLQERIGDEIERHSSVSIGQALAKIHTIATCPAEFDGDCDGLDALIYHLSGHACKQGIVDLQAVLKRFAEEQAEVDASVKSSKV